MNEPSLIAREAHRVGVTLRQARRAILREHFKLGRGTDAEELFRAHFATLSEADRSSLVRAFVPLVS